MHFKSFGVNKNGFSKPENKGQRAAKCVWSKVEEIWGLGGGGGGRDHGGEILLKKPSVQLKINTFFQTVWVLSQLVLF